MWPADPQKLQDCLMGLRSVTRLRPERLQILSMAEYSDPVIYQMLTRCDIPVPVQLADQAAPFTTLAAKLVGICLELELSPRGAVGNIFQPHLHALRHVIYDVHKPELDASTGRETMLHGRLGAPFFVQWKVSSYGLLQVYNLADASTAHATALPLFMCLEMLLSFLELVHGAAAFEIHYLRAHSISGIVNFGFSIDTYALRAYAPANTQDSHETQPGRRGDPNNSASNASIKTQQQTISISMPTRPRRVIFYENVFLQPEDSAQRKALFFALGEAERQHVLAMVAPERLQPFFTGSSKTTFTPGASIQTQDDRGVITTVLCSMTHETRGVTIKSVQSLYQLTHGMPRAVLYLLCARYARQVLTFLLRHLRTLARELFLTTEFACHYELLSAVGQFSFEVETVRGVDKPTPCGLEHENRRTLDTYPMFPTTHGLPSDAMACKIQTDIATGLMENLRSCCDRHALDLDLHSTKEAFDQAEETLLSTVQSGSVNESNNAAKATRQPSRHISKKRKIASKLALAGTGLTVKAPKKQASTPKALHKKMEAGTLAAGPLPLTPAEFAAVNIKSEPGAAYSSTHTSNKSKTRSGVNVEAQSCIITLLCWHLPKVSSRPNDPHFERLLQNHEMFDFFPQFRM